MKLKSGTLGPIFLDLNVQVAAIIVQVMCRYLHINVQVLMLYTNVQVLNCITVQFNTFNTCAIQLCRY